MAEGTRPAVVLVAGWNGHPGHWRRIQAGLMQRGYLCFAPRLPIRPWQANIREDAVRLRAFLGRTRHGGRPLLDGPVVLVGYSRGGLVARAYLRLWGPAGVAGVVLIGTPNLGTPWGRLGFLAPVQGLAEMAEGSEFLRWLNQDLRPLRQVPHLCLWGHAFDDGGPNDFIVWAESATLGGRLPAVCLDLRPGTDAWHGNLINRAWVRLPVPGLVCSHRCWPLTLEHVAAFLAALGPYPRHRGGRGGGGW